MKSSNYYSQQKAYNGLPKQTDVDEKNPASFRYKGYPNDFMASPRESGVYKSGQQDVARYNTVDQYQPEREDPVFGGQAARSRRQAESTGIATEEQGRDRYTDEAISADLHRFRQQRDEAEFDIGRIKAERLRETPLSVDSRKQSEKSRHERAMDSPPVRVSMSPNLGRRRHAAGSETEELSMEAGSRSKPVVDNRRSSRGDYADRSVDAMDFPYFHPWGKGVGNPRRDALGQPARFLHTHRGVLPLIQNDELVGTGLVMHKPYGGGGDPQRTSSGRIRTRFPITMKRDDFGNVMNRENLDSSSDNQPSLPSATSHSLQPQSEAYYPFGRPGAGAPLRNDDGLVVSHIQGKMLFNDSADLQKRQRAANAYLTELKQEMKVHESMRLQQTREDKEPTDGFATVLRQGRVGQPKRDPETGLLQDQHNPATDVTKLKVAQGQATMANSREYHDDLASLAKERNRMRMLDKMRDKHEDVKHEMHWKELWGKPGGGAPNNPAADHLEYKRANLDKMLFHPDLGSGGQTYMKNMPDGIRELSPSYYQTNYVQSSHLNNYQMEGGRSPRYSYSKVPYNVTAPFATDVRTRY